MPTSWHHVLTLIPLAAALGCDADCDNPGRMNGTYSVYQNVTADDWAVTGFSDSVDQAEVLGALFSNGWSAWTLKYVPGKDNFAVDIDSQSYTASWSPTEENCNVFVMNIDGSYQNAEGTVHTFTWSGDLGYMGDSISGTYAYQDTWVDRDTGATGAITFPVGEFRATNGAADSGLSE